MRHAPVIAVLAALCWLAPAGADDPDEDAPTRPPVSALGGTRPVAALAAAPRPAAPVPDLDTELPAAAPAPIPPAVPSFQLREIRLLGGEGLPRDELEAIIRPYQSQRVTLSDLVELRYRLTKALFDQGYINSGAILEPGQDIGDGIVTVRLIAGRLDAIELKGQGRLRPGYLLGRLQDHPDEPFNRNRLQERFQYLLEDPLIERLQGTLLPGDSPGHARLEVQVTRARPWDLALSADNQRPPSTGAERAYADATLWNVTGFGDRLDAVIGVGIRGQGREGALHYAIPLNARGSELFASVSYTDSTILEEPLKALDIDSDTLRAEAGMRQRLWRTPRWTLHASAALAWAQNRTQLLGESYDFSPSSVDGETRSTVLRLVQDLTWRHRRQALALRSQLGLGVDAFDATIHSDRLPDGRFVAWLGQGQYIRQLTDAGLRLDIRALVQLAGERLLPLEQFALGGATTVRGYRENEIVADSAYALSLELRHPLWQGQGWRDTQQRLELSLFGDLGAGWNHGAYDARASLSSIGLGLHWQVERLTVDLFWAHPFEPAAEQPEHDWQDDGFHFLARYDF